MEKITIICLTTLFALLVYGLIYLLVSTHTVGYVSLENQGKSEWRKFWESVIGFIKLFIT